MKIRYFILFVICAAICFLLSCKRGEKRVDDSEPRKIDVAEVMIDSVVLHKAYPGYLVSGTSADVVGQVDGLLLKKNYKAGSYVNKGQLLFQVDPTLYKYEVERAQAALASAIASRDYAKNHYDAVKRAYDAEAVSKMEVLSAESSLRQAEADIIQCQASLKTAQTNLGYCNIVAPISGYISDSYIQEGNYVNGADDPVNLATIYDNTVVSALFDIEDAQYQRMICTAEVGSPMYKDIPVQFKEKLHHDYKASLSYEAPNVNTNTGTIQLKGDIDNVDNELKAGMYVTIDLPYGIEPMAILVNDASIGTDQLGKYVYVVNESDEVVYTPVKVGEIYRDSLRIIESGLRPGDRYVTKALLTVRNGEKIKPVTAK